MVWDPTRRTPLYKLTLPGVSHCLALAGDRLWLGLESGAVVAWQHLGGGRLVCSQVSPLQCCTAPQGLQELGGHAARVTVLQADKRFLLSGAADGSAAVWSALDGTRLRGLEGHTSPLTCACLAAPLAATGARGAERAVRLWNIHTGDCLRVLRLENNVRSLDFDHERFEIHEFL